MNPTDTELKEALIAKIISIEEKIRLLEIEKANLLSS